MADIEVARDRELVMEQTGFRLSWGAVFAGFITATMTQIVLSLLGVAVGLSAWELGDSARDLGVGIGIWMLISALLAYFVGGMITGRMAGVLTRGDGAIHGVLMWGVSTLVNLWLLGTVAGTLLGGAFSVVRSTVDAAAGVAAGGVSALGGAAAGATGDIDFTALQREIETALRQTGDPALQPESIQGAVDSTRGTAAGAASNEALARDITDRLRTRAGSVGRQDVINVLVARGMSRAEAERVADRVVSATSSARSQLAAGAEQVRSTAEGAAETAEEGATSGAWWALLSLVLGAAAASWGAAMKAPE